MSIGTIQLENCALELVQPGKNASPWKEKLDRPGEGNQHIGYWPGGAYSFTNSVPQLGVAINIKTDDDDRAKKEGLLRDLDFHKEDL
jgi:hypothetical protein